VAADEAAQVEYVVERVLEHREEGIDLKRQAVLFRAGHHSGQLEVELARRGIPFVKYGGLKFLEAAHVKDMLCVLRWIENPKDAIAAFHALQLLPGVGPTTARDALAHLSEAGWNFGLLNAFPAPRAGAPHWRELCALLSGLRNEAAPWAGQIALVRQWYLPHLKRLHDNAGARAADLDQLEQIAGSYATRGSFLTELTLDSPQATSAEAGPPHLDDDYLALSTIHSAKGQEWNAVFVLNVTDGCFPWTWLSETTSRSRKSAVSSMWPRRAPGSTCTWCSHCGASAPISIGMPMAMSWQFAAGSSQTAFSIASNAMPTAALVTNGPHDSIRRNESM
jgi:DNA helicase-2/ATP-dependent DNA helicase PcrA